MIVADHPQAECRVPLLAWPSVLSLDALFVAVTWQQLLMRSFCNRSSTWSEMGALAATVWLIYVADRLLDAARLDLDRPHTLRHRFYRRHSRSFLVLWIVVLMINTLVVVRYLPPQLLRGGLMLSSIVLVYGAGVHFFPGRPTGGITDANDRTVGTWVPKEIRVGTLFALGVSLTVWTQLSVGWESSLADLTHARETFAALALATGLMAILFCYNCILVAGFEREIDRAQSFPSIATRGTGLNPCNVGWIGRATLAIATLTLLPMDVPLRLPFSISATVAVCAAGLSLSAALPAPAPDACIQHNLRVTFDTRSVWVDVVLWIPPVVVLCLT